MRIGEFAVQSGVRVDTLRYYDKIGLLQPAKEGQYRVYSQADLQKVRAIVRLKKLKFTLEEIQEILTLDAAIDAGLEVGIRQKELALAGLEMLERKYGEMIELEREIHEMKGQLSHLIEKLGLFIQGGESGE